MTEREKREILTKVIYRNHIVLNCQREFLEQVLSEFSLIKNRQLSLKTYETNLIEPALFRQLYSLYQEEISWQKKLDFDDMVFLCRKLFQDRPDVLARWQKEYRYILIDELAHTNAPGVRHHKRYQDIEELLHNGINVYTTVNIQHIESLNDVVEVITGIVVNERVPDRIFDEAETIALIDIAPRDLMDRLHAGKIYQTEQAKRALDNFFTEENLVALREIAAGHVSKDILKQRDQDYQTSSLDMALSANNLNLDGFSFQ